jgi:4-amino-4-deoxy-L-arabinose transferase-like glycosyltransferase
MAQEFVEPFVQASTLRRARPLRAFKRLAPAAPVLLVLAIAALALLFALRAPPARTLDVGARGDDSFVTEMLKAERDPASGITFRWTEPFARLWLNGTEYGAFSLALHIHNSETQAGLRELSIARGKQPIGTAQLAEGWRIYRVLLPDAAGGLEPLMLSTTAIHTPGDNQERGVPLDWARIEPLGRAPPWRALLLTWGLAGLAGWLWLLDGTLPALRPRWRGLRVAGLIGAVAVALMLWARADPYALAETLPGIPWTLGLASVLLAGIALGPLRARVLPRPALLALLVAAQTLLTTQVAVALGIGLALAGLMLLPLDDRRPTTDDRGTENHPEGTRPRTENREQDSPSPIPHPPSPSPQPLSRRAEFTILAIFFLAALGMRFYQLGDLPYGLWRDEGRHGLVALQMLADPGYRPAYIANRVDLPGLGLLPFTLPLRIWGIEVWSLRTITALAGAVTVLPLYGLTRRLFGRSTLALLAAGLLAVSSWSITISRFSFPTIFDPLLQVTGLWLLLVGLQRLTNDERRTTNDENPRLTPHASRLTPHIALFLSGVCLGLAMQTYHTGRLGVVVASVLGLLLLINARRAWRAWLIGVAVLCVGFVLAASPLIVYALRNPSTFNQRVGTVFLLSAESSDKRPPLTRLDESISRHLLMFNVRGDSNGRHAAPNRPMLDFVTGLGFLVGVAALLRRRRDWPSQFLLAALAIGLLPSLLAVDNPHAMRSIDALPIACIIAAVGLAQIWRVFLMSIERRTTNDERRTTNDTKNQEPRTKNREPTPIPHPPSPRFLNPQFRRSAPVAAGLAWTVALSLNAWTYFVVMPADREVWTAFYPLHTRIGGYIRSLADAGGPETIHQVYVPDRLIDNPVFEYLTYQLPVQTFAGELVSAPAQTDDRFILPASVTPKERDALIAQHGLDPTPILVGPAMPDDSAAAFTVYRKR